LFGQYIYQKLMEGREPPPVPEGESVLLPTDVPEMVKSSENPT
jgi:hypothetical protein